MGLARTNWTTGWAELAPPEKLPPGLLEHWVTQVVPGTPPGVVITSARAAGAAAAAAWLAVPAPAPVAPGVAWGVWAAVGATTGGVILVVGAAAYGSLAAEIDDVSATVSSVSNAVMAASDEITSIGDQAVNTGEQVARSGAAVIRLTQRVAHLEDISRAEAAARVALSHRVAHLWRTVFGL